MVSACPSCSRSARNKVGDGQGWAMRAVLVNCSVPFWQFSLAPSLWAVEQPDPWQSCRLLEPLPAHGAQRAAGQKPTHNSQSAPEQKASPSTTIKDDQKMLFPTMAQSQGDRQPPNCSLEADHPHDCRSFFFFSSVAASGMAGKTAH